MAYAGPKLPDYRGALAEALAALETATGFRLDQSQVIAPDVTFRQFCEKLGHEGLRVDGHPFRLDDRPAMAWVYDQIPSTVEQAYRVVLVLMKCAQVGFTVMEILATIYIGLKFGPSTVGMFLPDIKLTGKKSRRFIECVRSVPSIHKMMLDGPTDEGNVGERRIGSALFLFSWTSGKATTESDPMDMLSFDEVQEMTLPQMEKSMERVSASEFRFMLMGSTANWPDEDIHHWYKLGSQYKFHTRCDQCGTAKPLDSYFPNCIRWDRDLAVYRYVCPVGHWIADPQHGDWIAENPDAEKPPDPRLAKRDWPRRIRSIHFPQFLSPTISASEIIEKYNDATDQKSFYNRVLGKPWLDPSQVPVTLEHLARCVEAGRIAGIKWKSRASGAYMGIDQMGNYNVVVIKERLPDGRQATIHVEEIYSDDPFARCDELMLAYGIAACCVELNPNYNDCKRFANRHRGRVFIGNSFGELPDSMVSWGDAPKLDISERRTSEEERDRYTFKMDQYKCMQVSMARFCYPEPLCLFPDPQGLTQEVNDKGVTQMAAVLPRAFLHFTKTALVAEKDEETNKYKRVVRKIGIDPHFSYANMLCDVAWARAHGTSTFIIPEAKSVSEVKAKAADMNLHGLPGHVVAAMEPPPVGEVCGRCTAFDPDTGQCGERILSVQARDPGCILFVATS